MRRRLEAPARRHAKIQSLREGSVMARANRKLTRMTSILLMALATAAAALAQAPSAPTPRRPVHTFSIVARDPATGEMGVAVQSHWFSVGSIVTWAEAGVGAVATQSFVDPGYGLRALSLLKEGGAPAG